MKASAKYIRASPKKVNRYLKVIRGKKYQEAIYILDSFPSRIAKLIKKVIVSAGANAEENLGYDKSNLIIQRAFANQGPTLKRIQPCSRGMAHRIRKRTTHITVVLSQ